MENFFKINYEFDQEKVHKAIEDQLSRDSSDYICVADGVIANTVHRMKEYCDVINGGMFSICDSSYVPLYIRIIYKKKRKQYCGSQIFEDIIKSRKYRMYFLGSQQEILSALRQNLVKWNPDIADMTFAELPFCDVEDFDFPSIAESIQRDQSDIIWVSLGAPKQEYFMNRLKPHLNHGVMIAVGAAFKFFSGLEEKRAPKWMVRHHLEFVFRILQDPYKQIKRCSKIILTLPTMLYKEAKRKRKLKRN